MKWKLALGIIVSAVFLYFASRSVKPSELAGAFAKADYRYVVPAMCLSLISLWFRAVRWAYLTSHMKRIGLMSLLSATSIGLLANSVLPARLGEFIRAYVIGRKEGISKSSAFATIVVERVFDGLTVLALFIVVFLGYSHQYPGWLRNIAYFVAAFFLCAVAFIVFLGARTETAVRFLGILLKPFRERPKTTLLRWLHSFIDGLGIVKNGRNAIYASLFSFLVWLPNALIIYVLARSFDIALPISGAFVVLIIVTFGIMIPSAPAFLGTIQYCSVAGLSLFGAAKATALSFSVVYHLCAFLPIVIAGFLFLFMEGYSLVELRRSAGGKHAEEEGF